MNSFSHTYQSEKPSVSAYDTSMFLLINSQKIATQFVNLFFKDTCEQHTIEYDYKESIWKILDSKLDSDGIGHSIKAHTSLESFLNTDTFTKDVIILIRDPWERWKSAFHEDFIKNLIDTRQRSGPSSMFYGLTALNASGNTELESWWASNSEHYMGKYERAITKNEPHYINGMPNEFFKCMEIITASMVHNYITAGIPVFWHHNRQYHEVISNIMLTNKNLNKIKIFDIDKVDLNSVFSKYTVGTKNVGYLNTSKFSKTKFLDRVLEMKPEITERLKSQMRYEILAYQVLSQRAKTQND